MTSKTDGATGNQAGSQGNPPATGTKTGSAAHWYTSEIQQMMHGLGDCRKPLLDSAALVEDIVKQQMTSLVYKASDVASMRGGRFIGPEDLIFLMRKDKVKLRRILKYLQSKDEKVQLLKTTGGEEGDEGGEGTQGAWEKKKRIKPCMDFLANIDATGELTSLLDDDSVDDIKHERLLRAELQSRNMDATQYMEFAEARRVNLGKKHKSPRFREWLLHGVNVDIKPSQQSLEIFSYLAYETIAQIVDFALIVKQDMRAVSGDPSTRTFPAVISHIQDNFSTNSSSVSSKSSPGLTSPSQSPPSTPTSLGLASSTGSLGSSSGSSSSSKNKAKKRKKSTHSSSLDMITTQAIQPREIHEAIRRYSQNIGPFASMVRTNPQHSPRFRLMCC